MLKALMDCPWCYGRHLGRANVALCKRLQPWWKIRSVEQTRRARHK